MTFEDVLSDIEKMVGMKLESIRPGAEITIKEVDRKKKRIVLDTAKGLTKTRPFSHVQKVWEALSQKSAVLVDNVFNGSGTSRNQPETIVANLPYVEWLKLDGTKHVALVESPSHELGTLRKMNDIDAENLKGRMREDWLSVKLPTSIVVASDIGEAARHLEKATGLPVKPLEAGVYAHAHGDARVLLVAGNILAGDIEPGTYIVLQSSPAPIPRDCRHVHVADLDFYLLSGGGINLFISTSR